MEHLCHKLLRIWSTSRSFPHSRLINWFITRLTRRVSLVEQELPTFPEHRSSPRFLVEWRLSLIWMRCITLWCPFPGLQTLKTMLLWYVYSGCCFCTDLDPESLQHCDAKVEFEGVQNETCTTKCSRQYILLLSVTCDRSAVFTQYSGFLHQYNWLPRYNWNNFESGVKHHKNNQPISKRKIHFYS